ncbi:mechanosensitive ion channel [Desulfobulbus sp. US4]|nr:mechanosensitive ion channel [Desulfobulbus sp. US4]
MNDPFIFAWPAFTGQLFILTLSLFVLNRLWQRRESEHPEQKTYRQISLRILAVTGVLVLLFLQTGLKNNFGHVVTLIGILLSAATALASTTFISNFMAGIMLSKVASFRAGDFLNVGEHFGRVSEIGLLHTEIQTEDSDLTTLPNLFLVSQPCKVVRKNKTLVSATVSLGYDVPHSEVKALLVKAAKAVPLRDPFVHTCKLGDYSIEYRVAGVLENVKHLLSTRSELREQMLDTLHGAGIEIVSPAFMNTRALSAEAQVLSYAQVPIEKTDQKQATAETIIFDKADDAESVDRMRARLDALKNQIVTIRNRIKEAGSEDQIKWLQEEIEWRETSRERLQKRIKEVEEADA